MSDARAQGGDALHDREDGLALDNIWSLNILFHGWKPSTGLGFLGEPLPPHLQPSSSSAQEPLLEGHLRFALVELRGDWAWHCFSLQLKPRWNSVQPCFWCRATLRGPSPGMHFTNFAEDADWVATEVSHVEFLNTMLQPGPICALTKCNIYVDFCNFNFKVESHEQTQLLILRLIPG